MQKQFLKVFLLLLLSTKSFALEPFLSPEENKWGYKTSSNKVAIRPKYDHAYAFVDGFARVMIRKNGIPLYGFINGAGKYIASPKFQEADDFSDGLAVVSLSGKYGYIDTTGTLSVPPSYDKTYSLKDGMGRILKNDLYGYVNSDGQLIVSPKYSTAYDFSEERAIVGIIEDDRYLFGYINLNGSLVIPTKYNNVGFFSEGLANVKKNKKWGYIDPDGQVVIPLIYKEAYPFKNGFARVEDRGIFFIDPSGRNISGKKHFKDAKDFKNGFAAVKSSHWGYINELGENINENTFDFASSFEGNISRIGIDRKYGIMNEEGKYAISTAFAMIYPFHLGLGRFRVKEYELYGYLDEHGKVVIKPYFIASSDFDDKKQRAYALSQEDSLFTFSTIDTYGQIIDEHEFNTKAKNEKDTVLYTLAYPGIDFYKKDLEDINSYGNKIAQLQYGTKVVREKQNTGLVVEGHGTKGFWLKGNSYQKSGFIFSELVSPFPAPVLGSGLFGYFYDLYNLISTIPVNMQQEYETSTWFFDRGVVLYRNVSKNSVTDTYSIPYMNGTEAFFIAAAALGIPQQKLPSSFFGESVTANFGLLKGTTYRISGNEDHFQLNSSIGSVSSATKDDKTIIRYTYKIREN